MVESQPDRSQDSRSRSQESVRPGSILRAMQDKPRATLPSLDAPPRGATSVPTATAAHGEPKLEVVRVDGRVQKIVAVCGCGDRIVIHCDYEPTVQKAPPGGTP